PDDAGLRQRQEIVVALLVAGVFVKQVAVIVARFEAVALDHRAHCTVQDQDAMLKCAMQEMRAIVWHETKNPCAKADGFWDSSRALAKFVKRPQAAIKTAR